MRVLDDERLLAELRRILALVDPVPPPVTLAAREALGLHSGSVTPRPRERAVQRDEVASRPMADDLFRLVCTPGVLDGAPAGWVSALLETGELALLVDEGGLEAVTAVAHDLDLVTVPLLRAEETSDEQERTVMTYAGSKPLVWVAQSFGDAAREWAHDRGPMTLLVDSAAPLSKDERRVIERFVVILGRQAE
jgi:hypothetical protein